VNVKECYLNQEYFDQQSPQNLDDSFVFLVDLPAFTYFLLEQCEYMYSKKLPKQPNPEFIYLFGGEYFFLDQEIKNLLQYFDQTNIQLVLFFTIS